jgi:hypothetical protein
MALEPLTMDIILELFYISVGLVLLGLLLNWILGLKPEAMKELRNNARNLQERLKQAQIIGDQQLMLQLQRETMLLMKQMMKKQIAPMLIRCVIFLGIFALLSFLYGNYEYWFWVYFLFSLLLSLLAYGIRKAYEKLTGKESKRETFTKELIGTISSSQQIKPEFNMSTQRQNNTLAASNTEQSNEKGPSISTSEESATELEKDSWKNRIKN